MTEPRRIRKRAPLPATEVPEIQPSTDIASFRKLDEDEAAHWFPRAEPDYDYGAIASQLEAGQVYSLIVPEGHKPRTFYRRLLETARSRYLVRLRLAHGTGGQRLDTSRTLLFRVERIEVIA